MTNTNSSTRTQVVFLGDSITKEWVDSSPSFFTENRYIGKGISGQTTPQILARFQKHVLNYNPQVVVILAGTNDIAGNSGPTTNEMIQNNLKLMAEIAKSNKIKVILSSILPAYDFPWKPNTFPSQRIIDMNTWIKKYSEDNDHIYLDYWSYMRDVRNGLKELYTYDEVHVTRQGYKLMESLVQPKIVEALSE